MSDPAVAGSASSNDSRADRRPGHAAVPLLRRAVRRAAAVHPDRMRRHALLLARSGLAPRAGHAALRAGSALHAFHAQRAGAGAGAHRAPAGRAGLRLAVRESGLLDWIRDASAQTSAGSHRPTGDFRYYIGLVYVNVERYLIAAAYTTLVFLVRLLVLCLTLPLFLMAAFVGLVDGLVRRGHPPLRRGTRIGVHLSPRQASLIPLAVLPWVTYLALPVSVNLLILLPSAALLGVAVCIAAATFKKYL